MIEFLLEPLRYDFMQIALFMAFGVSIVCAVLSCFLVLKSYSLLGDALSHSVMPGMILAYAAGLPLGVGAFISSLGCLWIIEFLKQRSGLKNDAIIGMSFTGFFAFGLLLYSKVESPLHINEILFGNLLGVSASSMQNSLVVFTMVLIVILLFFRRFFTVFFDEVNARLVGLNPKNYYYLMLLILSFVVVFCFSAVGVILVVAMLILPGAAAFLVTSKFWMMQICAVSFAIFSSLFGIIVSFHTDSSTQALIVLAQTLIFVFCLGYSKIKAL
ncbi:metal ABC transporter permease [Campylobacter fetus]|uniref:metal ABC transporter permease n=1 Tax=Campylobacter fetus TaxID=196 RepID=UPI000FC9EE83|nr:metal ABC transporter permease [Campylobacter fetus]QQF51535.1 metal ABC transporter permease [Campylobacter fetus subsp. venerealis]RUT51104.1 protein AfeD [Campylobacter fetus]RUT51831.1 protein AfeD [Campylobacter fetus]